MHILSPLPRRSAVPARQLSLHATAMPGTPQPATHSLPATAPNEGQAVTSSPTVALSPYSARLASPLIYCLYALNNTSTQHALLPTNLPAITLQLADTQQPTTPLGAQTPCTCAQLLARLHTRNSSMHQLPTLAQLLAPTFIACMHHAALACTC